MHSPSLNHRPCGAACALLTKYSLVAGVNLKHARFWLILTFMGDLTIQNSQCEKSKRKKKKEQAFN